MPDCRHHWKTARIRALAEAHRLNILLTLTLDPEKLNGEDSTQYINRLFRHFRTYLKRKLHRSPTYIRILEHQKNGNAHARRSTGSIQKAAVSKNGSSFCEFGV